MGEVLEFPMRGKVSFVFRGRPESERKYGVVDSWRGSGIVVVRMSDGSCAEADRALCRLED